MSQSILLFKEVLNKPTLSSNKLISPENVFIPTVKKTLGDSIVNAGIEFNKLNNFQMRIEAGLRH